MKWLGRGEDTDRKLERAREAKETEKPKKKEEMEEIDKKRHSL